MYFFDGFVYGGAPDGTIHVDKVKTLSNHMLLLTFNNHEQRLFDATILNGPVFEPLLKEEVFDNPVIDHGIVTWNDGQIDCAPEYMYKHSYEYVRCEPGLNEYVLKN